MMQAKIEYFYSLSYTILLIASFGSTFLYGSLVSLFLFLANPANNPKYRIFSYSNVLTKLLTIYILLFGEASLNSLLIFRKINSFFNIAYSLFDHLSLNIILNSIARSTSSFQTTGMTSLWGTSCSIISISSFFSILYSYYLS